MQRHHVALDRRILEPRLQEPRPGGAGADRIDPHALLVAFRMPLSSTSSLLGYNRRRAILDEKNRVKMTPLPSGFRLIWLLFGFAEKPDVPAALRLHPEALGCDPDEASFFLGRETPVPSLRPHLSAWQQRLYAFMTRNAVSSSGLLLDTAAARR
jgi:hypothetical protein